MTVLSSDELWLTHWAVLCPIAVKYLFDPNDIRYVLHSDPVGLNPRELVRTLQRMQEQGLVEVARAGNVADPDTRWHGTSVGISPDLWERSGSVPSESDGLWYRLTSQGGAAWERYARPRWDRFVAHSDRVERGQVTTKRRWNRVRSASRQRLDQIVEYRKKKIWASVEPCDERRGIERPFRATYWKELPEAHWVEYEVTMMPFPPSGMSDEERWEATCYYRRFLTSWNEIGES